MICELGKVFCRRGMVVLLGLALLWTGCSSTYPKEKLRDAVQKLFQDELGVQCQSKLAGKTLYVSFPIQGLVSEDFELSKEVTAKLENAMLSISRIALSTNAEIDYTVLEAVDRTWSIRTNLIRRMQDLKDLIYWRISKTDFDERLILEIKKEKMDTANDGQASQELNDESVWHDMPLSEYMGRWVASRINLGTRSNPFLGVLLGIEKITPRLELENKMLVLEVDHFSSAFSSGSSSLSLSLFKSTIEDQMVAVEKKYLLKDWVDQVVLKNNQGEVLLSVSREEWTNSRKEKKNKKK